MRKKLATRAALAAVALTLSAAGPLAGTAHAYHCYSDVIGDCSVVQHMLEDLNYKQLICTVLEKATLGIHDC